MNGRSGCWRPTGSRASGPRRAPSAIESSGVLPAAPGERDDVVRQDLRLLGDVEAEGDWAVAVAAPTRQAANAIFAASGSQWMFHSVVGAVLPGTAVGAAHQRPSRRSRRGSSGSRSERAGRGSSAARSVTSVISPGRARRASSDDRSTAWRSLSGRRRPAAAPRSRGPAARASRASSRPAGRAAARRRARPRGRVRPASSSTARVFRSTWRASTLPPTHVTASSSASGEAAA